MATNNMLPIHLREIIREDYLIPPQMTAQALAMALHVPASRINENFRDQHAVTPDTALRLARYFNTTAQLWLKMQGAFDLKKAESAAGRRITAEIRAMAQAV